MTIPKLSQKKNIFCQNINFGKYILTFFMLYFRKMYEKAGVVNL